MTDHDPHVPPHPRLPHDYAEAGVYTITVTNESTKQSTEVVYDAAGMGALFTFPTDDAIPYLVVTRMKVGSTWELDWGDGTGVVTGTVPANASLRRSHTEVMDPGTYTVTVNEVVDGTVRRTLVRELEIPSVFSLQMNVSMSWRLLDEPRTITVTPTDTPADQTCTVDWGDGSGPVQVNGQGTASHTYDDIPAGGYLIAVDEDAGLQRRFHRLIGEPARVGEPHLSAWARWSAEVIVEGIPGLSNADWYGIDWGDGNVQYLAAIGAMWNAWHQYKASGEYTIYVDGPGMAAPVERHITIPTYPQPVVTAVEDTSDPTRMTSLVTVDNSDCGGDVDLLFGDGVTVRAGQAETVAHQYAVAGAYTVIARCVADTTSRGRFNVDLPWGGERTLAAVVEHDPGSDLFTARVRVTAFTAGKPVTVDWSDGLAEDFTPPTIPVHTYNFDDDYLITVGYVDGTESLNIPITIPFQEA